MLEIRIDDLRGPQITALLDEHLREMYAVTPSQSVHALPRDSLCKSGITFWSIWEGGELAGCGALKELSPTYGEIKSMRTAGPFRGRGVGSAMLAHIIAEARRRGYSRLSLETGSTSHFEPARRLYARFGFKTCGPFEAYIEDPNSTFMTLDL